MGRRSDPADLDKLVEVVGRFSDGASIEQLEPTTKVPRRTLQRRLASLIRSARLRPSGLKTRGG